MAKKKTAKKSTAKSTKKKTKKAVKKSPKKVVKKKNTKKATSAKSSKKKVSTRKLSQKKLDYFRDLLLIKRAEILGDVDSMEAEALRKSRNESSGNLSNMPIHMADIGTDNYEQEFALGLLDSERKILYEIDAALERIAEGTYGICEGTGKAINLNRLEANPWARYCIDYARMVEKGLIEEGEKYYENDEDIEDFDDEDEMFADELDEEDEEEQDQDRFSYLDDDEPDDDERMFYE